MRPSTRGREDDDRARAAASASCRICRSRGTEPAFEWLGYSWRSCPRCGALQKALSEAGYRALEPTYDPGSYAERIVDQAALRQLLDVEEKTALLERTVGASAGKSFLEVGCGMGGYLLAARDLGYDVCGVEPSLPHSAQARRLTDLAIIDGRYEPGMFDRQFDVIMLSHVIEHIYEPAPFLQALVSDLVTGGRLIVITPNAGSLAARVMGRYWSMLKPVDHVSMLTKSALRACCPAQARLELLTTSEWPGEFAALVVSALKSFLRPELGNVARDASTKVRPITTATNLGRAPRRALALLSTPFYLAAGATDNRACLLAVYRKQAPPL